MKNILFFLISAAVFCLSPSIINSQEIQEPSEITPVKEDGEIISTPSLSENISAGINEELQAAELGPSDACPVTEEIAHPAEEIVLIDDSLPEGAADSGIWTWDASLKYSGERSHTEPPAKVITEHSYRNAGIIIPPNSVIEQFVYLDPNNIPKGIMLKFSFEMEGKDNEIGIYREGEEEVFVFNEDEPALYDGTLPNAGGWEKLQISCDDLGLTGAKLTGISFVTYGGKVYWDLTRIRILTL